MTKTFDVNCDGFNHIEMIVCQSRKKTTILSYHKNEGIELCFSYKGHYHWEIEGVQSSISTGQASVTLPWQKHRAAQDKFEVGILAWFILIPKQFNKNDDLILGDWSYLPKEIQIDLGNRLKKQVPSFIGNLPEADTFFKEVFMEFELKNEAYSWKVNRLIDDLLLSIYRSFHKIERPEQDEVKQEIKSILKENLAYNWSVSEMADKLYMSRSAFSEKCRKETGYPPMEYLNYLRVQKAKIDLLELDVTITEVALRLGFSSSQYFSSVFKKWEGLTPSQYQRKL